MPVFGTYQGASTIMRKAFDWKRSKITMLEVEAVPQIGLSIVLYMKSLFLVERFDLRPSSQYILVMAIPSFLVFRKCVCAR
jgi:hypothetical protein